MNNLNKPLRLGFLCLAEFVILNEGVRAAAAAAAATADTATAADDADDAVKVNGSVVCFARGQTSARVQSVGP